MYVILDTILNHSGDVFEYETDKPTFSSGHTNEVKGFYREKGCSDLPMRPVPEDCYPAGAIWPAELQDANCFSRRGRFVRKEHTASWEREADYLYGDFCDFKNFDLGEKYADPFVASSTLEVLCEIHKYWIAYADIDGYRVDTVKHMGLGPTKYFANGMRTYTIELGKDNFMLIGEITGDRAWETVASTGLTAAQGLGGPQENMWKTSRGEVEPQAYFHMFQNGLHNKACSSTWHRDNVVTMLDDHDQIWRKTWKGRYCSAQNSTKLVSSAMMLNLCTLGIPCIYYGTEQAFDGSGGGEDPDRYIREAMFACDFGAFRSKDCHFFNEQHKVYLAIREIIRIRRAEPALRRGQQYLRDVSGDGVRFGPTRKIGPDHIKGIVAWSKIFAEEEILCAFNTDPDQEQSIWVNVDFDIHPPGSTMTFLSPQRGDQLTMECREKRSAVKLTIAAGGFVILK